MYYAMLAAIATVMIAAPAIQAQTTVPVNSRVRVTMRDGQVAIGRLTEVRGDTLVVIDDGVLLDSKYRITTDRMTRVDVSRGKYVHAGRVVGGALLGAVGGVLTVSFVPRLAKTRCSGDVCGTGSAVVEGMVIGAAAGIVLGILTPADRWEAVPSPVRIGFGGDGRHARLGVSFAF
jgi:hypothetical protein